MNVSVVIPLYNKRQYIRRAIASVLNQTYRDFELLVVDDGSTDESADCVREVHDDRLRLIEQPNGGECAARNRGVSESRHEWVAFLDADDEWLPDFLSRVTSFIQSNPEVVAVFTNIEWRRSGGGSFLSDGPGDQGILADYFGFALKNRGRGMTSSSVAARRSVLLSIGGFPVGRAMGGDLDTWLRLGLSGEVGYVPESLAIYHDDPSSAVATRKVNCNVAATFKTWLSAGKVPARHLKRVRRWVSWGVMYTAETLVGQGEWRLARSHLMSFPQSVLYQPFMAFRCLVKALLAFLGLRRH